MASINDDKDRRGLCATVPATGSRTRHRTQPPSLPTDGGFYSRTESLRSFKCHRNDPAKDGRHSDGRFRLKGVHSTSDIQRYTREVDSHSRKDWQLQEAYKAKRLAEHRAVAENTWNALHSFRASELPFNDWYKNVKSGKTYKSR